VGRRGDPQYYRNSSNHPQTTDAATGLVTQAVYALICKLFDWTDAALAWHILRRSVSGEAAGGIAWTNFISKGENDV
jgi:hypothetical protein